jgi:hypothetical protein
LLRENVEVLVGQVAGPVPLESSGRGTLGRWVGVKLRIDREQLDHENPPYYL